MLSSTSPRGAASRPADPDRLRRRRFGAFSRPAHLSVRTRRRYHEGRLLEPAVVDGTTGHRDDVLQLLEDQRGRTRTAVASSHRLLHPAPLAVDLRTEPVREVPRVERRETIDLAGCRTEVG